MPRIPSTSHLTLVPNTPELDDEPKAMLLEGLDAIDLTLKQRPAIEAFRARDRAARPWIYLDGA